MPVEDNASDDAAGVFFCETSSVIRAKRDQRSWKYARDEMVSIIFAVGTRAHTFVIKFKRLEFVLTESGMLDVLEKRLCATETHATGH